MCRVNRQHLGVCNTEDKDNGDGTYDIIWEEDDEEYTCGSEVTQNFPEVSVAVGDLRADKSKMELLRLAGLEEGMKAARHCCLVLLLSSAQG